jgi:hypothetical protein
LLEGRPSGKPMTLVAAMINVAVAGLYAGVIEDGIRLHAWNGPQLEVLESQLKEVKLHPLFVAGFANGELPLVCWHCENSSAPELSRMFNFNPGQPEKKPKFSFLSLVPRGWIYQNMVGYANLMEEQIEAMNPANDLVVPHKTEEAAGKINGVQTSVSPFRYVAGVAIPNTVRATAVMAHNQTEVNQALAVCALERYRLAHGQYPETLAALSPQFLDQIPSDIIGGQPPHYRRTGDGKFLLYSIAWTEKDHGGVPGKPDPNRAKETGDWVWPQDVN